MKTATDNQPLTFDLPKEFKRVGTPFLCLFANIGSLVVVSASAGICFLLIFAVTLLVFFYIKLNLSLLIQLSISGEMAPLTGPDYCRICLYLMPIVSGLLFIVIMIRPFFKRRKHAKLVTISKHDESTFFEYIRHLCRLLNVSEPSQVELMCDANALAGSSRDGWKMVIGGKTKLTIGLPYIKYMTISQLTGVLMHELRHLKQTLGGKLSFITFRLLGWVEHQVLENKSLNKRLEDLSQSHGVVAIISGITLFFLRFTGTILRKPYRLSLFLHNYSAKLSEIDADRVAIAMLGTREFQKMNYQTSVLTEALADTYEALSKIWDQAEYCYDIPDLVVKFAELYSHEFHQQLLDEIYNERPKYNQSHLTDKQRIELAKRSASKELFYDNRKASILFSDIDKLCRDATRFYYEAHGCELKHKNPVSPIDAILTYTEFNPGKGKETGAP